MAEMVADPEACIKAVERLLMEPKLPADAVGLVLGREGVYFPAIVAPGWAELVAGVYGHWQVHYAVSRTLLERRAGLHEPQVGDVFLLMVRGNRDAQVRVVVASKRQIPGLKKVGVTVADAETGAEREFPLEAFDPHTEREVYFARPA